MSELDGKIVSNFYNGYSLDRIFEYLVERNGQEFGRRLDFLLTEDGEISTEGRKNEGGKSESNSKLRLVNEGRNFFLIYRVRIRV